MVEDLVYDLSHGTGQERKAAEERFKKWRAENHEKIEKNKNLEYEESMKRAHEEEFGIDADEDDDSKMKDMSNGMNNMGNTASIHPVFSHMVPSVCIDKDNVNPIIPSKLLKDTEKLKKRQQKAAGFMTQTATLREKTEVLSGLFHFPQTRNTNGNHNGK
eukprot:CAMPEP_0201597288 /NCGR_PEP_ID=MMETSP0190_2-20130828/193838_1 /ASSEMBLY_ACC=CAM_ASM_000263 /TAXON_ID=37353 /ORGANISM="Rosalina sp." /LENGTH=159 /DNA_ID=CAMNT_0048058217 /DNA_START=269 /DNA_END=748 /DNA_ORIENTATION=-